MALDNQISQSQSCYYIRQWLESLWLLILANIVFIILLFCILSHLDDCDFLGCAETLHVCSASVRYRWRWIIEVLLERRQIYASPIDSLHLAARIAIHSVLSQSPFLKFLFCQNQRF